MKTGINRIVTDSANLIICNRYDILNGLWGLMKSTGNREILWLSVLAYEREYGHCVLRQGVASVKQTSLRHRSC